MTHGGFHCRVVNPKVEAQNEARPRGQPLGLPRAVGIRRLLLLCADVVPVKLAKRSQSD